MTIGAGGAGSGGGTTPANGTAGGTSTFETISATGGDAGTTTSGTAAHGTCSSVDATLRRSNITITVPPFINAFDIFRERGSGTAAVAWAVTSDFSPGSNGQGGNYSVGAAGAGGVGGAVLLLY